MFALILSIVDPPEKHDTNQKCLTRWIAIHSVKLTAARRMQKCLFLSHWSGFLCHTYDTKKSGNVTDDEHS